MPLSVNARVQAAQSFVLNVQSARECLQQQEGTQVEQRYGALLVQLKEAREYLHWNPEAGRPTRFLHARSAQGRSMADRASSLAVAHGVPQLRELIVKPYVLLYAHGDDRVVLLALKHERELLFQLP